MPDNAPKSTSHQFIVTVSGCDAAQAAKVIAERISPEEDLGFPYEIGYTMAPGKSAP